jgi:hypothetical protein
MPDRFIWLARKPPRPHCGRGRVRVGAQAPMKTRVFQSDRPMALTRLTLIRLAVLATFSRSAGEGEWARDPFRWIARNRPVGRPPSKLARGFVNPMKRTV